MARQASTSPLHFEDTSHLPENATPMDHVCHRGSLQPVRLGRNHPLITMFPDVFTPMQAPNEDLFSAPLHDVVTICASVCARPDRVPGSWIIGSKALEPAAMESRLKLALDQCGIPVKPYSLASWREQTEASLRGRSGLFTLTNDCFFDVEASQVPDVRLDRWPIGSSSTQSPLLHVYGDISNYLGPVTFGDDRGRESDASIILEFLMETMMEAIQLQDKTIRRLPMGVLYDRLYRVLEQSTFPCALALRVSTQTEIYEDITDRMIFWIGGETSSMSRLFETRFKSWLCHSCACIMLEFIGSAMSEMSSGEIFQEVGRLMQLARSKEKANGARGIFSVSDLKCITDFLSLPSCKSVWSYPPILRKSLELRVTHVLAEANQEAASLTRNVSRPAETAAQMELGTPDSFTSEMTPVLLDEFRKPEFKKLEAQLLAFSRGLPVPDLTDHQKTIAAIVGVPTYYLPLRVIFSATGASIAQRFTLCPTMRVLPKSVFHYIDELRGHWTSFATLRCIWDEASPLKPEMLIFQAGGDTLKNVRRGKFGAVNVLEDIYAKARIEIYYALSPFLYSRQMLTNSDSSVKDKYMEYMDRLLSTVGYPSTGHSLVGVSDSHMAIMQGICDFIEKADPLAGSRRDNMRAHAMNVLDMAESEAEANFVRFLASKNPAFPFPLPFVPLDSPAKHLLAKRSGQLDNILEFQGFDDSILGIGDCCSHVSHECEACLDAELFHCCLKAYAVTPDYPTAKVLKLVRNFTVVGLLRVTSALLAPHC
jgi:hypothetical protein